MPDKPRARGVEVQTFGTAKPLFIGLPSFYDGHVEGHRLSTEPNWVDSGALSLGIATYALVDGREAVVYDTRVSVEHARQIRRFLGRRA